MTSSVRSAPSAGIEYVELGVASLDRSSNFYCGVLGLTPIDAPAGSDQPGTGWFSGGKALIKLREVGPDGRSRHRRDLEFRSGYHHLGFKVGDVRRCASRFRAAGAEFSLEPYDAPGQVTVAFLLDPDGTPLELIDGTVRYDRTMSGELSERERLDAVDRSLDAAPTFDHLAVVVHDRERGSAHYSGVLGYTPIGELDVEGPPKVTLTYLQAGPVVLEVFSLDAPVAISDDVPMEQLLGIRHASLSGRCDAVSEQFPVHGLGPHVT